MAPSAFGIVIPGRSRAMACSHMTRLSPRPFHSGALR
jgi:hypothetical protein